MTARFPRRPSPGEPAGFVFEEALASEMGQKSEGNHLPVARLLAVAGFPLRVLDYGYEDLLKVVDAMRFVPFARCAQGRAALESSPSFALLFEKFDSD